MLVKFFRNFRCRYSVDDLGNIFDGMTFSELEPVILEAFGRNSEEYDEYQDDLDEATRAKIEREQEEVYDYNHRDED